VHQHGIDWMGFDIVKQLYFNMWQKCYNNNNNNNNNNNEDNIEIRFLSSKLIDSRSNSIASAEIGVLIGSIYSCISHYTGILLLLLLLILLMLLLLLLL
jgi:hypothetical protein